MVGGLTRNISFSIQKISDVLAMSDFLLFAETSVVEVFPLGSLV